MTAAGHAKGDGSVWLCCRHHESSECSAAASWLSNSPACSYLLLITRQLGLEPVEESLWQPNMQCLDNATGILPGTVLGTALIFSHPDNWTGKGAREMMMLRTDLRSLKLPHSRPTCCLLTALSSS